MKITGRVSLRYQTCLSDQTKNHWRLEIEDEDADVHFLDASISEMQFSKLLANHEIEVPVELRGMERLGTKSENKTEKVPWPGVDRDASEAKRLKACKPFMEGGWRPRIDDFDNNHNRTKTADGRPAMNVVFYRNVPKKEEPS